MSTDGHPLVARSLAAVAVLHTGLGLVAGRDTIRAAVNEGLVGAWAAPAERRAAYWFLVTGASLMVLSTAARARGKILPRPVFFELPDLLVSHEPNKVADRKSVV